MKAIFSKIVKYGVMKCKMSYTFAQCSDKNEGNLKAIFWQSYPVVSGNVFKISLQLFYR